MTKSMFARDIRAGQTFTAECSYPKGRSETLTAAADAEDDRFRENGTKVRCQSSDGEFFRLFNMNDVVTVDGGLN